MSLTRLIRYLRGERRGMGSELTLPSDLELTLLQTLRPRPSIAIQTSVQLADISFCQETVNFETMRDAGLRGVIIRAGQRSWVDSRFRENWERAKAAKLPRGSYWFYDSRETPKRQAEIWSDLLGGDYGELLHACDFEEKYGGQYGSKGHFKEFINWFQDFTKLPDERIACYTGFFWWLERIGNDIFFRRYPLWLAWYAAMQVVKVPAPWQESELLLWQYTSSGDGALFGVSSKEIDLNWYCCDLAHYNRRFGLNTELPPTGEPMLEDKYFKVTAALLNLRSSPAVTTTNDIGDLKAGDIVRAAEVRLIGDITWHRIEPKVFRGGVWLNFATPAVENWCAEKKGVSVYMETTDNPTPPLSTEYILHVKDGVTRKFIPE